MLGDGQLGGYKCMRWDLDYCRESRRQLWRLAILVEENASPAAAASVEGELCESRKMITVGGFERQKILRSTTNLFVQVGFADSIKWNRLDQGYGTSTTTNWCWTNSHMRWFANLSRSSWTQGGFLQKFPLSTNTPTHTGSLG